MFVTRHAHPVAVGNPAGFFCRHAPSVVGNQRVLTVLPTGIPRLSGASHRSRGGRTAVGTAVMGTVCGENTLRVDWSRSGAGTLRPGGSGALHPRGNSHRTPWPNSTQLGHPVTRGQRHVPVRRNAFLPSSVPGSVSPCNGSCCMPCTPAPTAWIESACWLVPPRMAGELAVLCLPSGTKVDVDRVMNGLICVPLTRAHAKVLHAIG